MQCMNWSKYLWPAVLIVAAVAVVQAGCASAYHEYPCGTVPYRYCAEPALPYRTLHACPTPVATETGTGTFSPVD